MSRKNRNKKKAQVVIDTPKVIDKPIMGAQIGVVGTDIFSGQIDIETQAEWRELSTRIKTIDNMLRVDDDIMGVMTAYKKVLLSAKYLIEPASEEQKDIDNAEFIERALFEEIDFEQFLYNAYTFLDYGFSTFAENYKIENGEILWRELRFMEQHTIDKWSIDGMRWYDGHPPGITQVINTTDDNNSDQYEVKVPWQNLILFTNERKGNNFEGVSMLRPIFRNYKIKSILIKIASVSADRFGVGTPIMYLKSKIDKQNKEKYEEMLRNIRSSEKGQALLYVEDVDRLEILTPNGTGVLGNITTMIEEQQKGMYRATHTGHIYKSTSGEGSHALSSDTKSFFLEGAERYSSYVCSTLQKSIDRLCGMNLMDVSNGYPKLICTDLGSVSLDEITDSLATLKGAGLISWSDKDEDYLREKLKLPEREEDEERGGQQGEVIDIEEAEIVEKKEIKKGESPTKKGDSPSDKKLSEPMLKDRVKITATDNVTKAANEIIERYSDLYPHNKKLSELIDLNPGSKKEDYNFFFRLAEIRRAPREAEYTKNITNFENYLGSEWSNIWNIFQEEEKKIQDKSKATYEKATTKIIDGVKRIDNRDKKNRDLQRGLTDFIKASKKKVDDKMVRSKIQDRLFDNAQKFAFKTLNADEKFLAEIVVNRQKFNAFQKGYISNIQGNIDIPYRQQTELVNDNFGLEKSINLVLKNADGTVFNSNLIRLSTISHSRGSFNAMVYDENVKRGFTFYKTVVPKNRIKDLAPTGISARALFLILTAGEINRRMSKETNGRTTDAINGLNAHHNAFLYFYPILEEDLEKEKAIAQQQREALQSDLQNK